jgi:hypothetical protein
MTDYTERTRTYLTNLFRYEVMAPGGLEGMAAHMGEIIDDATAPDSTPADVGRLHANIDIIAKMYRPHIAKSILAYVERTRKERAAK